MKIVLVHNLNGQAGGEGVVVQNEKSLESLGLEGIQAFEKGSRYLSV
jgi:hypothetical protein